MQRSIQQPLVSSLKRVKGKWWSRGIFGTNPRIHESENVACQGLYRAKDNHTLIFLFLHRIHPFLDFLCGLLEHVSVATSMLNGVQSDRLEPPQIRPRNDCVHPKRGGFDYYK